MSHRSRSDISRSDIAWLAGQGVLFLLAFIVLPQMSGGPGTFDIPFARPVGLAVMVAGVVVLIVAFVLLGRQLVPQPTPIVDGQLIERGLYRVVRHPIYTGVLLLIAGGLFRTPSITGLLVIIASIIFFDAKSAHEERLLIAQYPDYPGYRERTRYKLLPGIR